MGRAAELRAGLARVAALAMPGELFVYGTGAIAFLYLRSQGLHYGWNTIAYFFPQNFRLLPHLFALGVGTQLVATLFRRDSLSDHLRALLRPRWLLNWLRAWVAAFALAYTYVWLKVSVPLVRHVLYDEVLWRIDRFLHFGLSPSVFTIELVARTPMAFLLDQWYTLWGHIFVVVFAYALASRREEVRRHFLLANAVLWTLGAALYVVVPALGPCYASPDILEPIKAMIPSSIGTQKALWANYITMVRGREGVLEHFQPFLGVAAMPSLHVGSHALFALWARRHEPRLFGFFLLATALTFMGSLATGWHYAIDGYAGLLLAWLGARVADRFGRVVVAPAAPRAAESEGS